MAKKSKSSLKKSYIVVIKPKEFLTKTSKAGGVTLAKDKKGYFVYSHRGASKRYKTIMSIPKSVIEFIESTG